MNNDFVIGQPELNWGTISLGVAMTLFHLTWMVAAIGFGALILSAGLGRCAARYRYAVNLAGLGLMTLAVPVAFFAGSEGVMDWQGAGVMQTDDWSMAATRDTDSRAWSGQSTTYPSITNQSKRRPADRLTGSASRRLAKGKSGSVDWGADSGAGGNRLSENNSENASQPTGATLRPGRVEADRATSARSAALANVQRWVNRGSPWLAIAWLAGTALMMMRLGRSWLRGRQMLRSAAPVDDRVLLDSLDRLAARLRCRRVPRLSVSEQMALPILIGCWRPVIVLPLAMVTGLAPRQCEPILLHELAHLRRWDHWVVLWQRLAECVLFFHPLIWSISKRLDRDRERCCDDRVLQCGPTRIDYAQALCAVANVAQKASRPNLVVAANGLAANDLVARVERILDVHSPRPFRHRLFVRATWPLLIACALVLAGLLAITVQSLPPASLYVASLSAPQKRQTIEQQPDPYPIENCLEMDEEDVVLLIRGAVFLPDGQPATPLRIKHGPGPFGRELNTDIEIEQNQFTIRTRGNPISFRIETADTRWGQLVSVADQDLRRVAQQGLSVVLQPIEDRSEVRVPVAVTAGGQPVPGVHVAYGKNAKGVTNAEGKATLRVNCTKRRLFERVLAWTDDGQIGVSERLTTNKHVEYDGRALQIDLHPTREMTFKIVDRQQQPVGGLQLRVVFSSPDNRFSFAASDREPLITDDNGVATTRWCPEWEEGRVNVMNAYTRIAGTATGDGVMYFQTHARISGRKELTVSVERFPVQQVIQGQIACEGVNPGGFLIEAKCPGGHQNMRHIVNTLTDADGGFKFAALPNREYQIRVVDPRWISNIWRGIAWDPDQRDVRQPQLRLSEGTPAEIRVTRGTSKSPVPETMLHVTSQVRSGTGRTVQVTTGSDGVAQVFVRPGRINVKSFESLEYKSLSKELLVRRSGSNSFEVQLEPRRQATFGGQIHLPQGTSVSADSLKAKAIPIDSSRPHLELSVEPSGRFQFQAEAENHALLVWSEDEQWAAIELLRPNQAVRQIDLQPTVTYRGKLVDAAGNHLAGCHLRLEGRFPERKYGDHAGNSSNTAVRQQVTTDLQGEFAIDSLPTGLIYRTFRMNLRIDANNDSIARIGEFLGECVLAPNDIRPPETLVSTYTQDGELLSRQSPATRPPGQRNKSLEQVMQDRLLDCRLSHTHCLVVINGVEDRQATMKLVRSLDEFGFEGDEDSPGPVPPSVHFLPVLVDAHPSRMALERREQVTEKGWPIPGEGQIRAVSVDGTGRELGQTMIHINDSQAKQKLEQLLRKTAPSPENATNKLEHALAEAKATNRTVWLQISQTRCAPCFQLSRWQHEHRELIEKDFVLLKVDNVRDIDGVDVLKEYLEDSDGFGVPIFFFLDAQGERVADSIGPMGNIGWPGGSHDGTKYLLKVLGKLRRNLTDEDLKALHESLGQQSPR